MTIEKPTGSKSKVAKRKTSTTGTKKPRKKAESRSGLRSEAKFVQKSSQADLAIPVAVTQSSQSVYWTGLLIIGFGLGMGGYQYFHPSQNVDSEAPLFENQNGRLVAAAPAGLAEQSRKPASEQEESETQNSPVIQKGKLDDLFVRASSLSTNDRIEFWSDYIEKNPKVRSDLKTMTEGEQVSDTVPLVPNRLNSQVFIEIVSALSRSETSNEFAKNLVALRYQGSRSDLENRNFFPDVDWIPNNVKAGFVTDLTNELAISSQVASKIEKSRVDRNRWLKHASRKQKGDYREVAPGNQKAEVQYIELSDFKNALSHLGNGTVLSLVHKADSDHPGLITQQGFVIKSGDQILFRRATLTGKVSTDELWPYLQKIERQSRKKKWPLAGVHLLQINASSSTRSLPSASL